MHVENYLNTQSKIYIKCNLVTRINKLTILENYEKILKYVQIKKYVLNNELCNFYNIQNIHAFT